MDEMTKIFGEPISTYSAQQAVEDGVLVAITRHDAVTRTAWEWIKDRVPLDAQPPNCWPVNLMGWFQAGDISPLAARKMIAKRGLEAQKEYEQKVRHDKTLALTQGLISRESQIAIRKEEQGGGIHTLYIRLRDIGKNTQQHILASLDDTETPNCQTVYLRPNECGGVTLMFPEDN